MWGGQYHGRYREIRYCGHLHPSCGTPLQQQWCGQTQTSESSCTVGCIATSLVKFRVTGALSSGSADGCKRTKHLLTCATKLSADRLCQTSQPLHNQGMWMFNSRTDCGQAELQILTSSADQRLCHKMTHMPPSFVLLSTTSW